jgi:hypothetical protein
VQSISGAAHRAKNESSRRFLLTYRRADWKPSTAARYRYFPSECAANELLARLRDLARYGPLVARLEVREGGRWREIQLASEAAQ